MFSQNLSVPDFVRRFFVSCAQISEAYAVRTVMKFGCDWRKIGHKGRCRKDSERTLYTLTVIIQFLLQPFKEHGNDQVEYIIENACCNERHHAYLGRSQSFCCGEHFHNT